MTAGSGCDAVTAAVDRAFSEGLLPSAGPIVVGVSGGQDSLALIHALRQRVPEGAHLHAVHVNHCLRPESETDSRAVQRAVRAMGVSIDVRQYDVGLWAERRGLNLEAAARSVRYRLLASTAATMGTAQIVTGHTGGDQVETILMHLLRGAGPDGLVGLLPRQSIPLAAFGPPPPRIREGDPTLQILRPILDVERWETAEYCFVHKLSVVFDSTNEETTYLRNRIRHQLVPLLETYNPSVRDALRKLARLSQDDAEALHEVVNQEWVRYARVSTSAVRFPRVGVGMLRRAILARLIRRAAGLLIPGMGLSFDQVERCIRAMERERSVITLSRGLEWSVTPDLVILSRS